MYRLKQFIGGVFFSAIIFVTQAAAENKTFHGYVTLPTSITDLLDTCSGVDCPSVNIGVHELFGDYSTSWSGGSVDYNDTSRKYEYHLEVIQNEVAADDSSNNYQVSINIINGNMGNEYLYYSFGTDNSVGMTGGTDTADVIIHQDSSWDPYTYESLVYHLNLPLEQTDTIINIDLSTKDDGRQKVTGKIKLPAGVELGPILDDNGTQVGYNNVNINIYSPDYSISSYIWMNDGIQDVDGLYTFTSSINNESNVDLNLSLGLSAWLDGHQINTNYQIGVDALDVDDHSIDGDEKLVTNWIDPSINFATFSSPIIDFGTLDVDAYLVGSQLLTGTFTPPDSFPIYYDEDISSNSIYLSFSSSDYVDFWFYSYFSFSGYNTTPPENGIYDYEILIPQDIQGKIEDNNLSVSIEFSSSNYLTDEYGYINKYYTFGDTQQVGGGDDHILDGACVNPDDAKPLSVDFSSTLPIVDINLSEYTVPPTTKMEVTLTLPEEVLYAYINPVNVSCEYYGSISTSQYDNGDGTTTLVTSGLEEGNEYGFTVDYETGSWELGTDEWYSFMLNDNDGDFTNGGSFLDTLVWDEITWMPIFDQTYIATDSNVVFSPFEIVAPAKAEVSPAVIMYLLN